MSQADGGFLKDHYCAQTFYWANRYWACAPCKRVKANRFPLEPGSPRAAAAADREALAAERPMMLDPCADEPEEHLLFSPDGTVSGLTDRGRATIEIFDLNRSALCADRKSHAAAFLSMFEHADDKTRARVRKALARHPTMPSWR